MANDPVGRHDLLGMIAAPWGRADDKSRIVNEISERLSSLAATEVGSCFGIAGFRSQLVSFLHMQPAYHFVVRGPGSQPKYSPFLKRLYVPDGLFGTIGYTVIIHEAVHFWSDYMNVFDGSAADMEESAYAVEAIILAAHHAASLEALLNRKQGANLSDPESCRHMQGKFRDAMAGFTARPGFGYGGLVTGHAFTLGGADYPIGVGMFGQVRSEFGLRMDCACVRQALQRKLHDVHTCCSLDCAGVHTSFGGETEVPAGP